MLSEKIKRFHQKLARPKTRRYIDPSLGVKGFFEKLKETDIDYVVLRWFDDLPHIKNGEDIDILVSDKDVDRISVFFTGRKMNGIPCDLYSESGLPGTSFRKMAYYPPHLARTILDSAVWKDQLYRVPDDRHHFFSMAYHVLYHKGEKSGIPGDGDRTAGWPADHDYAGVLATLAEKTGMPLPDAFSLENLDMLLKKHGWQPGMDTLEKLSKKNRWVQKTFFSADPNHHLDPCLHGLSVFILRENGTFALSDIEQRLFHEGFDLVLSESIPPERRHSASQHIRGGNWGKGPWAVSGGLPAHIMVAVDLDPMPPDDKITRKHTRLTNYRVYKTKLFLRDLVNTGRKQHEQSNAVHSSDNARQALEYIEAICPEKMEMITTRTSEYFSAFQSPYPVIRKLRGTSRRAKVEKVDYKGIPAVCKLFRQGRERFMHREIEARQLAGNLECMTRILEEGSNYIIIEWIDDCKEKFWLKTGPFGYPMLPVRFLRKAQDVILFFRRKGYEYIDFKPQNMLITRQGGIKLIDFEFLQFAPGNSHDLKGNYAWYPVPETFEGDLPEGYGKSHPFRKWKKTFGLPLCYTNYDLPGWAITLTRAAYSCYLAQRKWPEKLKKQFPSRTGKKVLF